MMTTYAKVRRSRLWIRASKSTALLAILLGTIVVMAPGRFFADPSSRIARASYIDGQISVRHGSSGDWMGLVLNFPLTDGDQIWTDADARTELHFGSSALRLSEHTALEVVQLGDDRAVLSLTQGTVDLRVRTLGSNDRLLLETPSGRVSISREGSYRITVSAEENSTEVSVRDGEVRVTSAGGAFDVQGGRVAIITGEPNPRYDMRPLDRDDDFDRWAYGRDREEDRSESARYVSREMTGYEALDGHGRWEDSPDYGPIWIPMNVSVGWAPYAAGRWAWVDPWGWTWIDDQPWGFAPFHYGRWAQYRGGWVWAPGIRVVRPVYSPALVVFVGGGGWSASAQFGGSGGVAWFPLAPGEPWEPGYRVSDAYRRNQNVTYVHVTNIVVVKGHEDQVRYRNREVEGGVTAVSHETFVSAKPTRGAEVRLASHDYAGSAPERAPQAKPEHDSRVVAAPEGKTAKAPPPNVSNKIEKPRVEPVVRNTAAGDPTAKNAPGRTPAPDPKAAPVAKPEQPKNTPQDRPAPQPVNKPESQPMTKPAPQPANKPAPQPANKPESPPVNKPAPPPTDQPPGKSSNQPNHPPAAAPPPKSTNSQGKPAPKPAPKPTPPPAPPPKEQEKSKPARDSTSADDRARGATPPV